ncbi:MAG: helix-turn-helix transcriptional regulator [Actinomycetia bacterium]|nr:helix-turn-helix transcriptional regulator [Actinomycetes bacterium]
MTLCNRLKEMRVARNLTQEALAQAVGVTRQSIIAIEKGKYVPSVRLALELAQALEAPLQAIFWLAEGEGR